MHLAVGYPGSYSCPISKRTARSIRTTHGCQRVRPARARLRGANRHRGTVVVRGGGIVASRVLQRLIDDRDSHGAQTQILHLFRTFVDGAHGPHVFMRRRGGNGWSFQGFNWPKAAWGGQIKARLESSRATTERSSTRRSEARRHRDGSCGGAARPGASRGWYKTFVGEVDSVVPGDGQVITRVRTADGRLEIPAHYVIDATGLEADIREHRLLADLMDHSGAGRNRIGRLDVERNFEVRGTRSAPVSSTPPAQRPSVGITPESTRPWVAIRGVASLRRSRPAAVLPTDRSRTLHHPAVEVGSERRT